MLRRTRSVTASPKVGRKLIRNEAAMLQEKLKEAIISELKRQAANSPRLLQVDDSKELIVKGKINIDELVMVIAGSVAGGP
jgi:hypothetical protein